MSTASLLDAVPFRDATSLIGKPEELRARAKADGYLFFRGLLPAADVLGVRSVVLAEAEESGWTDATRTGDGVIKTGADPVIEGDSEAWRSFYCRVYKRRELHALNHHPKLIGAFEGLFGEAVLSHPRVIARVMFPNTQRFTTPPHQDHFYIGGTPETWTAWVPLGDCGDELGGLVIAMASHHNGLLPVRPAEGAGGHRVVPRTDLRWAAGAFRAGDVLTFHSHTIHRACDNRTIDRLRLSCDFRFQALSAPVDPASLAPHMQWLSWSEVYDAWPEADPLRHYWERRAPVAPPCGVARPT